MDPFLDTKTETRKFWGLCPRENGRLELGPESLYVAPSTTLTNHLFPAGRGSNTHRLIARLNHRPARKRLSDGMLLPFKARPAP